MAKNKRRRENTGLLNFRCTADEKKKIEAMSKCYTAGNMSLWIRALAVSVPSHEAAEKIASEMGLD